MRSQQATLEMVVDARSNTARQTAAQQPHPAPVVAEPEVHTEQDAPTTEAVPRGFFARMAFGVRGYLHGRTVDDQFRWNVPPQHLGVIYPQTVYCVELPVPDPVGMLTSYTQSGVKADHVVFVGDPLTMTDDAYYHITQQGALVHETRKGFRRRTQEALAPHYAQARPVVTPTKNPNQYTYKPRPSVATKEELQAHIDAIAAHKR